MEKTTAKHKSSKSSFSPMQGNKYKNFLTSILSPSSSKRHTRRKMLNSSQALECPVPSKSVQQSNESIYSSIEDVEGVSCHRKSSLPSDVLQSASSSEGDVTQRSPYRTGTRVTGDALKEPVYATVHKPPQKPKRMSLVNEIDVAALQETKEDNKMLQLRMKELSEENCHLKKRLQVLEKQEKTKEVAFHSLQLKATQLETETRKEVKSLSDLNRMLSEEKSLLTEQLDLLHKEKREAHARCEALSQEVHKKVDPEFHTKTIAEYRRLLEQAKQKYNTEVTEYKEQCERVSEAKESMEATVQELRDGLESSRSRLAVLEDEMRSLCEEKAQLQRQVEESRQMEEDHQKLLLSLLKVTETLAVERDILLNKTAFQENQQKELQTSVVGYSLNVGRLQEHITNLSKENVQELLKLHSRKSHREENVHEYYTEQLDILREKILNQSNIITKLESEKRKLEMQLETRWESYS